MVSDASDSPLIDAENEKVVRPTIANGPSEQRLSARGTGSLREEAIADDGTARIWGETTKMLEEYLVQSSAAMNTVAKVKEYEPASHRFDPKYADDWVGKIYGGLGHIEENCPPSLDLQTVHVVRTGWPFDNGGRPAPPVEFLDGLGKGRKAFLRTLRRSLDRNDDIHEWGRVSVREPHEGRRSGYPHAHDGIVVVTTLDPSQTESIARECLSTYVETNPFARECDHGDDAVRVLSKNEGDSEKVGSETISQSLGAELTNSLVGYNFDGPSPLDGVSDAVKRYSSLLWATGKRSITLGQTFRGWVKRSQADYESEGGTTDKEPLNVERVDPPDYIDPEPVDVGYEFPDEYAD